MVLLFRVIVSLRNVSGCCSVKGKERKVQMSFFFLLDQKKQKKSLPEKST
jgi:hypothetical protein